MKFDLVVSDYDGTLGRNNNIDKETVEAIRDYVKKGGKFIVCTGRMCASMRQICLEYGLKGPLITYQGSMISDIESQELLLESGLDVELAKEVTQKLLECDILVGVELDDTLFYETYSDYAKYYEKATRVKGKKVKSLIKLIERKKKPVLKVTAVTSPEIAKELVQKFNSEYEGRLIANSGAPHLVELINPKCSKGEAVRFLSQLYNIPYDKIMTVGDSTNDIELIRGPWYGVAVGDASDKAKEVAKEVTVPFEQKPIKVLLEKYCLDT